MESKSRVSILYLGKKGGGAQLTLELSEELVKSQNFNLKTICLRRDNLLAPKHDQSKVEFLLRSSSLLTLIKNLIVYKIDPQKLLKKMKLQPGDVCLVPMTSPYSLAIENILIKEKIDLIRVIHDAERHRGDLWPTNFTIRKIIKSSRKAITLSEEVDKKIRKINPLISTEIYQHPAFNFGTGIFEMDLPTKYILFLGRIRTYKGLELLLQAFPLVDEDNLHLVIAGEGKMPKAWPNNVSVINRWISELEIWELIARAEVIVFPYLEASQSGLIPYCIDQKKKIVITSQPGLLEQSTGYSKRFVVKELLPDSLSKAIETSLASFDESDVSTLRCYDSFERVLVTLLTGPRR